jgi:branched-chain amino acid transport system permease protein
MLLQQLLNGIGIGCTYALIALGYNLTLGVLKVVNLAYGEIFVVGAFAALTCMTLLPASPTLAALAAVLSAVTAGLLVHVLAVKPLGNVSDVNSPRHLSVMISTMGCALIIQNLLLERYGANPLRFPSLIPERQFIVGGLLIDGTLILNVGVTAVSMCALYLMLNRSTVGLRIRAMSENKELALCSGIRAGRDEIVAVIVSSALAGIAAVLISQSAGSISPLFGLSYGFKGLIVLIVGGAGNMVGTVLCALVLGITEVLAAAYLSSSYRDAVAFGLLVALLIGREMLAPLFKRR